ncbi:MAG: rhodanese-like domain-containing protein [Phycisphaerales bacterium]
MSRELRDFRGWFGAFVLVLVGLGMGGCNHPVDDSRIRRTTVQEVQTLLERNGDRVLLIDSRAQSEVDAGTIPGSVAIRPGEIDLNRRDPWLEGFSVLVVFAENRGSSSARVVSKRLMMARYRDVRLMEAGIDGWRASGGAVGEAGRRGAARAR